MTTVGKLHLDFDNPNSRTCMLMRMLRLVVLRRIKITCNFKHAEEIIFHCYYHRSAILFFLLIIHGIRSCWAI